MPDQAEIRVINSKLEDVARLIEATLEDKEAARQAAEIVRAAKIQ